MAAILTWLSLFLYLSREITQAAMELLTASWSPGAPVRALTVTAQNLLPADQAGEQLSLLVPDASPQRQKIERLERAMDDIRSKYGKSAITSARTQNRPSAQKPIPPGPKRAAP